ncbi:SGNH/GDSL hydrolase family protein [Mycolicibacterium sp. P9-22]|uniref:SGNH/GDSL hydrolase family protein n=1 Tax=Mycolicibacterium sp. P9-22 TaxID=2024613 RepID=UPI0011ED230E|nr:SGNH/GDSL hydrolase family protein [Mycolicibacterium sp. P9-22]KAA0112876.1 lipase [Mycolicibacterium sp. P9-22]
MLATTPISMDLLRGARELEPTAHGLLPHRLPGWARAQCADPQLAMAESQPAGCRLVFQTESTVIELEALRTRPAYRGVPMRPDGVYDLTIDGELAAQFSLTGGNILLKDAATGTEELQPGAPGTIRFADLPGGHKTVEIWLPHNETTELISLRSDHPLEPRPITRPVWLHHGSSISHGSNAVHPTGTWPALAAAGADVELINLGLGGAALLDPFTARTMRDIPAQLISIKIGINIVNADLMRLRGFGPAVHGFLDTIRDGHPKTPIVVVSALYCPIHEETPGPLAPDFSSGTMKFVATGDPAEIAAGKLTLSVTRRELAAIVRQRSTTDPNIHYVDGLTLYGPADHADFPLADNVHPGPEVHQRVGERFAHRIREINTVLP